MSRFEDDGLTTGQLAFVLGSATVGLWTLVYLIRKRNSRKDYEQAQAEVFNFNESAPLPQPPAGVDAPQPPAADSDTAAVPARRLPYFTPLRINNMYDLRNEIARVFNGSMRAAESPSSHKLLFLDFRNARDVNRASYRPLHGYLDNFTVSSSALGNPQPRGADRADRRTDEIVAKLKELGKLSNEESGRVIVKKAKGSQLEYALIFSEPRIIRTGKRRPFSARVLTAVVQVTPTNSYNVGAAKNPITGRVGQRLNLDAAETKSAVMDNYGINNATLDMIVRILFMEQSVFGAGQCWHRDPLSDGVLCDLQRRAILNALLNRINKYKRRRGIRYLDSRGIRDIITGWVGAATYDSYKSRMDNIRRDSNSYTTNEAFVLDSALLPSFTENGEVAIHPWGWSGVHLDRPYPSWTLHTSDGGSLTDYPLLINYGLYN